MWPLANQKMRKFGGRYPADETECLLVSNFGLLKSCPARTIVRPGRYPAWAPDLPDRHRAGAPIYVHSELLDRFAARGLPRIQTPFTLLSGNSTMTIRPGPVRKETLDAILGHPHLRHWFAQNLGMSHPGMSPVPLGMDWHTLSIGRQPTWGPPADPARQEAELDNLRRTLPPLGERAVTGYCNWHFATGNPFRAHLPNLLDPAAVMYQPARMPRLDTWRANAQHLFTISPRGRGMDCHRTWESLAIGAIPVVDDLPFAPLFEGLPVLRVGDWRRVTPGWLAAQRGRMLDETFDFAPMLARHWRARITGDAPPAPLRMRFQTFLDTPLCALDAALKTAQAAEPQHYTR